MRTSRCPIDSSIAVINRSLGRRNFLTTLAVLSGSAIASGGWLLAAEPAGGASQDKAAKSKEPVPLNMQETVLLDVPGKRLLLKTRVVLREGLLEMLCCLKQTKEHESILAIESEAYVIHAGLLALGAKPGSPVKFQPEYMPPTGTRIRLFCQWTDSVGKPH